MNETIEDNAVVNAILPEGLTQVCVLTGIDTNKGGVVKLKRMLEAALGITVHMLEEICTAPDSDDRGYAVKGTGGRNDIFFAITAKDARKVAAKRLEYGIRWLEDVLDRSNYHSHIYPERVFYYLKEGTCSWDRIPKEGKKADG